MTDNLIRQTMVHMGAKLKTARAQLKLSQADVAHRADISTPFYGKLERATVGPDGVPTLPSLPTVMLLSGALGIEPNNLFGPPSDKPVEARAQPHHPPRVRQIIRKLSTASPTAVRLVSLLLTELAAKEKAA